MLMKEREEKNFSQSIEFCFSLLVTSRQAR